MKYQNANKILPEPLILEIQKYVQGEYLYIPAPQFCFKKWGEKSGVLRTLAHRNKEIKRKYKQGSKVIDLAEEYFLSVHTIKQIIYKK